MLRAPRIHRLLLQPPISGRRPFALVLTAVLLAVTLAVTARAQSDLDEFMARVLARRDDNWKRLQQYVLDERETAQVIVAGGLRAFGMRREYTWFVKDGFFVRSPVRFDGVTLSEQERREYEARWIEQERAREAKAEKVEGQGGPPEVPPQDIGDFLRQTKEPRFVSAAYFLRFKFEPGRYAFVGRESFGGRTVLRIEYYPERLFGLDERDEAATEADATHAGNADIRNPEKRDVDDDLEKAIERKANKVALITLWVEPEAHQIVQYTFDNVGLDFLPGRWLVRLDSGRASMRMREAFPGVWLPEGIDAQVAVKVAAGTFAVRYDLAYLNYRQPDVKVQVR